MIFASRSVHAANETESKFAKYPSDIEGPGNFRFTASYGRGGKFWDKSTSLDQGLVIGDLGYSFTKTFALHGFLGAYKYTRYDSYWDETERKTSLMVGADAEWLPFRARRNDETPLLQAGLLAGIAIGRTTSDYLEGINAGGRILINLMSEFGLVATTRVGLNIFFEDRLPWMLDLGLVFRP